MKKLILAFAVLPALAVNAQTQKKVMLEDFTGIWCQYCPNGTKGIQTIEASADGPVFIPVASHNDGGYGGNADLLMIAEGDAVAAGIGVTGFPTGAVDRKLISGGKIPLGINANADQWKSAVATRKAISAIASVGFANLKKNTDGTYEGDVKVKFVSAPTAGVPIKVNVYVLENKIEATGTLQQRNVTQWFGGNGGSPAIWTTTASSGNTFYHDHTLRAALGGTWGWADAVPASPVVGTEYTKHFKITIPGTAVPGPWKPENMEVVGFVAYDGASTSDQKEVMNAERVSMSLFFPANVNNVTNNVEFMKIYPNPAKSTDVMSIEYNIANSEKVTLNVYNTLGQLVATPYVSEEVKGAHTILWRPSNDNLAAGLYVIELSSASGKTTQRLNLQ